MTTRCVWINHHSYLIHFLESSVDSLQLITLFNQSLHFKCEIRDVRISFLNTSINQLNQRGNILDLEIFKLGEDILGMMSHWCWRCSLLFRHRYPSHQLPTFLKIITQLNILLFSRFLSVELSEIKRFAPEILL